MRVLLADDDLQFRREVAGFLAAHGVAVEEFEDLSGLDRALASGVPGLVLLDLAFGVRLGIGFLRHVLHAGCCPALVVSDSHNPDDREASLQLGANAYLDKGVGPATMLAVLRGLASAGPADPARACGWQLLPEQHAVHGPGGPPLRLTSAEFGALSFLHERQGIPVGRGDLFARVFRRPYNPEDRAIDTLVSKLRGKLASVGASRPIILTIRSAGYVFTGFPTSA